MITTGWQENRHLKTRYRRRSFYGFNSQYSAYISVAQGLYLPLAFSNRSTYEERRDLGFEQYENYYYFASHISGYDEGNFRKVAPICVINFLKKNVADMHFDLEMDSPEEILRYLMSFHEVKFERLLVSYIPQQFIVTGMRYYINRFFDLRSGLQGDEFYDYAYGLIVFLRHCCDLLGLPLVLLFERQELCSIAIKLLALQIELENLASISLFDTLITRERLVEFFEGAQSTPRLRLIVDDNEACKRLSDLLEDIRKCDADLANVLLLVLRNNFDLSSFLQASAFNPKDICEEAVLDGSSLYEAVINPRSRAFHRKLLMHFGQSKEIEAALAVQKLQVVTLGMNSKKKRYLYFY